MRLYECAPIYHPLQDSHFLFFLSTSMIFLPNSSKHIFHNQHISWLQLSIYNTKYLIYVFMYVAHKKKIHFHFVKYFQTNQHGAQRKYLPILVLCNNYRLIFPGSEVKIHGHLWLYVLPSWWMLPLDCYHAHAKHQSIHHERAGIHVPILHTGVSLIHIYPLKKAECVCTLVDSWYFNPSYGW